MKKIILSAVLTFATLIAWSNDEFSKPSLDQNFDKLDQIEQYVSEHPGTTLNSLKSENNEIVQNISLEESASMISAERGDMPIVSSFWWGCCLGVVGLALVYFITDNDKAQVKSALIGCVIATLLWGVGGLWNPFNWY